jgi:recombination protein RecA
MGISSEGCILDLGIEHKIVEKSGSFFSYGDERLGQGRNNAKAFLRENPDRARAIEDKIYEAMGIERDSGPVPVAAVADPVEAEGDAEATPEADEAPEAQAA